jgi:hypothetical protein
MRTASTLESFSRAREDFLCVLFRNLRIQMNPEVELILDMNLINLPDNAIKYTPRSSHMVAERRAARPADSSGKELRDGVGLAVSDSGRRHPCGRHPAPHRAAPVIM